MRKLLFVVLINVLLCACGTPPQPASTTNYEVNFNEADLHFVRNAIQTSYRDAKVKNIEFKLVEKNSTEYVAHVRIQYTYSDDIVVEEIKINKEGSITDIRIIDVMR